MPQLWETAINLRLPCFPCNADKKPTCPHGFKDASRDPAVIERLFADHPGELIGIPTGDASGIDALDLDTTRHSEAASWMKSAHLPQTRVHQTKSGGWHYIFRHKPGLRNWTSRPVPGVDGRADGGYIIFWPAAGFPTNQKPVIEWPDHLAALFENKPKLKREEIAEPINDAKLAGVARAIAGAVNGQRNDLLFWGACRVAEWIEAGDLTRRVGEAVLMSAGQHAGLPEIEIVRTIASALTRGRNADSA